MRNGLRTKLNFSILSSVIVIMILLVGYFSFQSRKSIKNDASLIFENLAHEMAAQTLATFNVDLGTTQALASSFEAYHLFSLEQLQEMYKPYLERTLEKKPHYLAYWISLELNNIDPNYTDLPGRITWIYDRLSGTPVFRIEYRDTIGSVPSPQYQEFKKNKTESLIDPYWYNPRAYGLDVDSLLEATIGVPVMLNNEVVGMAGIDFSLDHFHFIVDSVKRQLEVSDAFLISNDGTIVTATNQDFNGQNIESLDLFSDHRRDISEAISMGKSDHRLWKLPGIGKQQVTFSPITIGTSTTPWSICILTPMKAIQQKANHVFLVSMLLGLLGIVLVNLIVITISGQIIKPIVRTTAALESLSTVTSNPIASEDIIRKDEIGIMTRALNSLYKRFESIINFTTEIGKGNLNVTYPHTSENDQLGASLIKMQENLINLQDESSQKDWLKTGINGLNDAIRGDHSISELSRIIIKYICSYSQSSVGALYHADGSKKELNLGAGFAFSKRKELNQKIKFGEGLVGQCAIEKEIITLTQVPDDYFPIKSATGSTFPRFIQVSPCLYDGELMAVLELAKLADFTPAENEFLKAVSESIAIAVNRVQAKEELKILLSKTLEQKEELQAQEEELREANQQLEKQADNLRKSEASLQAQQEELKVTNQELEKNALLLEEQSENIKVKNQELEQAHQEIEKKAKDLEIASKYKSEFLANMSHELRTPLNSMLILSQSLSENVNNTLSTDEIESAQIIYKSGNDLLNLINEILDLSKIEAGKMSLNFETTEIQFMANNIHSLYKAAAIDKKLDWATEITTGCPSKVYTDQHRLEQVIKNLVTNALKFTDEGSVKVIFSSVGSDFPYHRESLKNKTNLRVDVIDTGIGIPEEKQAAIFEAFQQADGTTARRFGGTGLGLSISRELISILGGEMSLTSDEGKGSCFTIILPLSIENTEDLNATEKVHIQNSEVVESIPAPSLDTQTNDAQVSEPPKQEFTPFVSDDRDDISEGDSVILVIEDDPQFAGILRENCHKEGFKCIATGDGESGLALAKEFLPSAILLDIKLPGMNGWEVLDILKRDTKTRHIPVHIASGTEENISAYQKGAIGYLHKPATKESLSEAFTRIEHFVEDPTKKLLIVEDNDNMRTTIKQLLKGNDVSITEVGTAKECLKAMKSNTFDCIILDLGLPDQSGFEMLREFKDLKLEYIPPVIVYTGQELEREEHEELQQFTKSIIIKGVKSEERLLDEATLFLHRVVRDLPQQQQKIIQKLYERENSFDGKKILLVDDDMRNIFALTKVFEDKGLIVKKAENGVKAINLLKEESDFDVILMDIMMPEMDGYETIGEIRKINQFKELPIIALTAKAMKEDRQKCLDAGATDYISKPVDVSKLLSLLRVWLSK